MATALHHRLKRFVVLVAAAFLGQQMYVEKSNCITVEELLKLHLLPYKVSTICIQHPHCHQTKIYYCKSKEASLSYPVVCVWNVHGRDSQVMDKGSVITPCSWQVSHTVRGQQENKKHLLLSVGQTWNFHWDTYSILKYKHVHNANPFTAQIINNILYRYNSAVSMPWFVES